MSRFNAHLLKTTVFHKSFCCLLFFFCANNLLAQQPVIRLPGGAGNIRRPSTSNPDSLPSAGRRGNDTTASNVERRDYSDDSLQVDVFFLSSVRPSRFDSSILDFTVRFPIPATHYYLGNDGSATKSFLFTTPQRVGFDPGFHTHDVYKWKLENARFFNTQKPYTELGYVLSTGQAQTIEILHIQNLKPYWNASFQYRLVSAPGVFRNRKNYHTNYQFTSWYQSPGKRYNNYLVVQGNKIQAAQSGGILADQDYLGDEVYQRSRLVIPTNIGGEPDFRRSPFSSVINTAQKETEFLVLLRQQYDLGRKDSLVTDSTVIPLFYPRLRFEHAFKYGKYTYLFQDLAYSDVAGSNIPNPAYYDSLYNLKFTSGVSLAIQDRWQEINNHFSVYQFPDANNLQQYIKLGLELQLLKGTLKNTSPSLYNIIAHGEYRNRTKNQKWDINASGRLHTTGTNFGDYHFFASLQRSLGQTLGTLQIGGENINRSPPFIYDQRSSFYLDDAKTFGKENTFHFFANYYIPKLGVRLLGDYYFVTNYLFLNSYRGLQQESSVFNLLRVSALKTFRVGRRWNLHSEVYVQQKAGSASVNVPLVYTRNRFAYEGKLFRNLNLSTGLEMRYNTPYKADNYSPVLGQFFYQDTLTIGNRPDLHAFAHLRIRNFKAYVRVENLNTATFEGGFGFNRNSLAGPYYPLPGMFVRFGIYWVFVN